MLEINDMMEILQINDAISFAKGNCDLEHPKVLTLGCHYLCPDGLSVFI